METSLASPADTLVDDGFVRLALHADGVAHLHLNQPGSANGLNVEMLRALHAAVLRVHGDGRVRALLLSGEGKNFCAGGDVHTFLAQGKGLPDYIRVATALLQLATGALMRLNPPVVTVVQGYAAGGGGMGLVCASDFVVAAESARFLAGATRVAMVPDAGVSVTLTQLVGLRRATEILMLNPVLTAREAKEIGLITRVVADGQLQAEAWALARQLAAGAPKALANTKRLLWNGIGQTVESAMPEENHAQAMLCGMDDALEGLAAVIEKRAPVFKGH